MTFPGLFGPWSSWSSCDASSCGNSPSSHKIRVQTTCTRPKVNATNTNQCMMLYRFEEGRICIWKPAADMDLLTVRIKVIASLSSWGFLFIIIIISVVTLRMKEQESKNAIKLFKATKENAVNTVEVQMEPPKGGGLKGGAKTKKDKRKKKKEEGEDNNIGDDGMEL